MRLKTIVLLLILALIAAPALANDQPTPVPAPTPCPTPAATPCPLSPEPLETTPPINCNCAAALLCEQDSGQVIFCMNPDVPRPVASVTKVMTLLLTLEQIDAGRVRPEDVVTISKTAAGMGGSQVLLDVGERQSIDVLLKSAIVGSANDAAVALAEALYGSEETCVRAMNQRAAELGMTNTHFVNCTGLPADGQHTTARDVAAMSRQLFSHPRYFDYSDTWMDEVSHGDGRVTQLVNTNKLIRLYDGCDGGKTGSTREAGYCVSATASRGGMRLIAVVLGAGTGAERFDIASKMLDHGFANYRRYPVARRGTRVRGSLPVIGGDREGVGLTLGGDLTLLLARGDEQNVKLTPALPDHLDAPVRIGDPVGSVRVTLDGRTLAEIPVTAAETVQPRGLNPGIKRFWTLWPVICAQ